MTLKPGDRLTLTIHDIAFGGEGVGRAEDFVVFVPFVMVGEEVEAEIAEVKKNFARAKLLRVVKPSPERVEDLVFVRSHGADCRTPPRRATSVTIPGTPRGRGRLPRISRRPSAQSCGTKRVHDGGRGSRPTLLSAAGARRLFGSAAFPTSGHIS